MPVCQRCGYKWEYEGRNKTAYCYRCNRKLSIDRKKKEILEEIRNNSQKYIEAFKKELINEEISDKIVEDKK